MRTGASLTAAFVASARGLGSLLGDDAIARDPYGARFGGRLTRAVERAARAEPVRRGVLAAPMVRRWIAYMQTRTRAIDDELLDFVAAGGRQVVILGAGYDCRAARFAAELDGARVFEIDHPATQARKRAVLDDAGAAPPVVYVAWDFEARPLAELPGVLARLGLDPDRPTLTIWEGVTMYLSAPAIEATIAAIRQLGGAGSRLVFTYVERAMVERPRLLARAFLGVLAQIGEPFRFGWDPDELPAWLAARGLALRTDRRVVDLAVDLLPADLAAHVHGVERHVAVAVEGAPAR